MGELIERINANNKIYGNTIAENFKTNCLFFYDKYKGSDKEVTYTPLGKMQMGGFYFLHYNDDSNWMRWSPIFACGFKKFGNMIIILGVNFNFMPLEIRSTIFDPLISKDDFEKNKLLAVEYEPMYKSLLKYGFEYALVEYNAAQVELVHKINMSVVPRFIYSQHPRNKYDPAKLYEIWTAKIKDQAERDREMGNSLISDFYEISDDILSNYKNLKDHIARIQNSLDKYG